MELWKLWLEKRKTNTGCLFIRACLHEVRQALTDHQLGMKSKNAREVMNQ